jgi:dihydrofolate reductase
MSKLKVSAFAVSIDGFGAGVDQSLNNPLGVNGTELHQWFFHTPTFARLHGQPAPSAASPEGEAIGAAGPADDVDDQFARRSFDNIGAWILGRNMFSPTRGAWVDDGWRGWWGDNPPYHVPVFVLTHHARPPLVMAGGTVFHFVTGGIHVALTQARAAAQGRDVRVGGGVATVRQYLQAGLVDEMHLALAPTLLGRGEALLSGIDLRAQGLNCTAHVASPHALHVVLSRN